VVYQPRAVDADRRAARRNRLRPINEVVQHYWTKAFVEHGTAFPWADPVTDKHGYAG